MRRSHALLAVLLLATGFITTATASDWSGKLGLTGILQAAFPVGEGPVLDLADDAGIDGGGMLSYGLSKHWAAGVSYDLIDLQTNRQRVRPLLAHALYRYSPDKKWTPSAQLGVGVAQVIDDGKLNNLAARLGLGYEWMPCDFFSAGPQITYTYAHDNGDGIHRYHILGAGVIASIYFGGPASLYESKERPEVPAPAAAAPAAAVTAAAVAPPPPVDSDGDGVLDPQDQCPDTAKGIPIDASGCPQKFEQKVSLTLNVLFDTGKAAVKPEYRAEIEQVANFLKTYPNVNAEIEGHTDNIGPESANQRLSQRRAEAVREYLIKEFAVDSARVKAAGYGPARPISDNGTAEGRAQNRRVVATLEAVKVQ